MLFKEYHIPMIRSGSKTVTRREWDENYHGPNVGTVVAAKTDLLKPDDKCDCFIQITGKREEPLGEISEESARKEGDYGGIEEFREGYEDVYGEESWDAEKVVNVIEFDYVGKSRPGDDGSEQAQLVTDGGTIDRDLAEKERGLLEMDYASPCVVCGGVVFEWWDSQTCRGCENPEDGLANEQATLVTGGRGATHPREEEPKLLYCDQCVSDTLHSWSGADWLCDSCGRRWSA